MYMLYMLSHIYIKKTFRIFMRYLKGVVGLGEGIKSVDIEELIGKIRSDFEK